MGSAVSSEKATRGIQCLDMSYNIFGYSSFLTQAVECTIIVVSTSIDQSTKSLVSWMLSDVNASSGEYVMVVYHNNGASMSRMSVSLVVTTHRRRDTHTTNEQ
jgi:hypothetical protein